MCVRLCSSNGAARGLPLLRVQAGTTCDLVSLSTRLAWFDTHYLGRQVICPGQACPYCLGEGGRAHGYLVGQVPHGQFRQPVLLEVSSQSWTRFEDLLQLEGGRFAAGLVLGISRKRKNSPLVLEPIGSMALDEAVSLPENRVLEAVAVLFQLPVPGPDEDWASWGSRVESQAALKVAAAMAACS